MIGLTESVACGTCTACCRREMIALTEHDRAETFVTQESTHPLTGEPVRMIPHKPDGSCHYLGEAGCTISNPAARPGQGRITENTMKRTTTVLALAALALSLAACGPYQLTGEESERAQLGARENAERSQAEYVSCSGMDSDKDGYVTCTKRARTAPHAETEILCGYRSRGCKAKS